MQRLRTPIVCVVGHVDHGKTTLLDFIRGSAVAKREAGLITQHIGATEVPMDSIQKICGELLRDRNVIIPGLLFIDTPGHRAFTTLRSRGSSLADLAVLVIDINEGVQPQTVESLEVLRRYQTPFVVAANKIDLIDGWVSRKGESFVKSYGSQLERAREELDRRLYEIVGELSKYGFSSERYDRVRDFSRNVCIVPISAKTGEGIPDLLAVLIGLSQRFLRDDLYVDEGAEGRGTVLEVKEERGMGTTIDVILWDGELAVGDTIVLAGEDGPVVTKVRAILRPRELSELREERRFRRMDHVTAAAGIKIIAPNLERVLAGYPLIVARKVEDAVEEMKREMMELTVKTDPKGIVVRADTLGSLEGLVAELRQAGVEVVRAEVGDVSRRDLMEASAMLEQERTLGAVLAFNVRVPDEIRMEAEQRGIKIFEGDVIYQLVEEYQKWTAKLREEMEMEALNSLIRPAKIKVLEGYVFRVSKPAIVGVRVLGGVIKPGTPMMKPDGRECGEIRSIQSQGVSIPSAKCGEEVAVSIDGVTVGRQIKEGDILYSNMREEDAREIRNFMGRLSKDEVDVMEEIIKIKRGKNPLWGI